MQTCFLRPATAARGLVVAGVIGALAACSPASGQEGGADERPPPEVGVVELGLQSLALTNDLPGRTAPYRVADVRPQVSGLIRERSFRQGAEVEAGDTLYRIEPRRFRAAVARAQGELAAAQADVPYLERRVERRARLVDDNHESREAYEDAVSALERARAEVEVAEAQLETARTDLDYTSVEAPISGRVGPTRATAGALVTARQDQPLTRITQLDPIYVDIQRSVSQVRRLRRMMERGQLEQADSGAARVRLRLPEGGMYPHAGELEVSDITVDPATSSVTLRAVFPNPEHDLLPGMYVRARVSEGVRRDAILAPQQGVGRNPRGEPTALVVTDDNTVERRALEVSRAVGSFWLVESGLAAGDRLIVSGLQRITAGDTVRPVPADIPNRPPEDAPQADSVEAAEAAREADGGGATDG